MSWWCVGLVGLALTWRVSDAPQLCVDLKSKDVATTFKKVVSKRENLETLGGMSHASSEGECPIKSQACKVQYNIQGRLESKLIKL